MQNETSDASWSFLNKQSESDMNEKSDSKQSKVFFNQHNSWKNYAFILIILSFIVVISILNNNYTQMKPDLAVLNKVIDLIDESDYLKNIQLIEAIFSTDQIKVTIRSEEIASIQSSSQGYQWGNEIPYEIYQKGKYNYLNFIFPWKGNKKGGDIIHLQSMANKTVFSNKTSINHTEDIFEIQGGSSDIISFLLQMAENKQIQEFNFSVSYHDSGQFNLKVQN